MARDHAGLMGAAASAVTFLHGKLDEKLVFGIESAAAGLAIVTELLALRSHHHAMEIHSYGLRS